MQPSSVPHPQEWSSRAVALPRRDGGCRRAGHWHLACGEAVGLHPRRGGRLSIGQGAVWITVSGPGADGGDRFLCEGETLLIAAGQHAVLEPWAGGGRAPEAVEFTWDETGGAVHSPVRTAGGEFVTSLRESWRAQRAVAAALLGLGRAVAGWMAGRAHGDAAVPGH